MFITTDFVLSIPIHILPFFFLRWLGTTAEGEKLYAYEFFKYT